MASKAKSDTTNETALSAVEEALSIDFNETPESSEIDSIEAQLKEAADEFRQSSNNLAISESELIDDLEEDQRRTRSRGGNEVASTEAIPPSSPPAPANDAHSNELSSLLYSIQQKPQSNIFLYTAVISVAWLALCGFLAYQSILPGGDGFSIKFDP